MNGDQAPGEAASDPASLEEMVRRLEESGRYKVLRRLDLRAGALEQTGPGVRHGLFVDVETTGLDPVRDEIIELAMVPFAYALDGRILSVGEPFNRLRRPSKPIPPEITALTGINDAMVAGQNIEPDEVGAFAAGAAIVVAHNAAFDRRFLERFCPTFSTKAWACSMSQIDWAGEGVESAKLAYLAMGAGFFYDRHRAANDCLAAVHLLSQPLPRSGAGAFARLMEEARRPTWRIWAENSPFDLKDLLKARGYRWNAEGNGAPKAWYVDVPEAQREAELHFLKTEIYRGEIELLSRKIDAYDRFSERC